jgi:hypothetical protein
MSQIPAEDLLKSAVRLPQHIVHRSFVSETVVLNLETGKYHGLNPTGGRMVAVLERAPSVAAAAEQLAAEFGQPLEDMRRDICLFCEDLLQRGLIELDAAES